MAVRSVIDIDVNDGSFQRFHEHFKKYHEALTASNGAWASAAKKQKGIEANFAKMTAALLAQKELVSDIEKGQEKMSRHADPVVRKWERLSHFAEKMRFSIGSVARHLLSWGTIGGVIGGISGVGSLWGLERAAASVGNQRKQALGLGLSIGQQRAFGLDFGRFVNAPGLLQSISEGRANPAMWGPLLALGVNMRGNTAQVAESFLDRLRQKSKQWAPAEYGQMIQAYGLGQYGVTIGDLRRLRHSTAAHWAQTTARARQDALGLGISDQLARNWQTFDRRLSRSGLLIENTLIKGLTGLTGPLGKLSGAFSGVIAALLKSGGMKELIGDLTSGLSDFAKYVGTPKFKTDMAQFVSGFDVLVHDLIAGVDKLAHSSVGRWLGFSSSAPPAKNASGLPEYSSSAAASSFWTGKKPFSGASAVALLPAGTSVGNLRRGLSQMNPETAAYAEGQDALKILESAQVLDEPGAMAAWHHLKTFFPAAARQFRQKFPRAVDPAAWKRVRQAQMIAQEYAESSFNPNAYNKKTGAKGLFQFTAAAWKDYRPWDEAKRTDPLAQYMAYKSFTSVLRKDFPGNIMKQLAGYYAGPGAVQSAEAMAKAKGGNWEEYVGPHTKAYVGKVLRLMTQLTDKDVHIYNQTGGNSIVVTNALKGG